MYTFTPAAVHHLQKIETRFFIIDQLKNNEIFLVSTKLNLYNIHFDILLKVKREKC